MKSVHQHPAVHFHRLAQDVASGGGRQEQDDIGDFFRSSGAALGNIRHEFRHELGRGVTFMIRESQSLPAQFH